MKAAIMTIASLLVLGAVSAGAGPNVVTDIGFDVLPDGTPIPEGTQISAQYPGVLFNLFLTVGVKPVVDSCDGSSTPGYTAPNILTIGYSPGPAGPAVFCQHKLIARFVDPVFSVSSVELTVYAKRSGAPVGTVTATAYDGLRNVVDEQTLETTAPGFDPLDTLLFDLNAPDIHTLVLDSTFASCISLDRIVFDPEPM